MAKGKSKTKKRGNNKVMRIPRALVRPGPSEDKYIHTTLASQNVDTIGAIVLLNGATLGTDVDDRIGRQTRLKRVEGNLHSFSTSGTGTRQVHRIILFYDLMTDGVAPDFSELLYPSATYGVRNPIFNSRFLVVDDWQFSIGDDVAANQGNGDPGVRVHQFDYKLDLPVQYNGQNNGTVADLQSGGLFLGYMGSNANGVTAGAITGVVRVWFRDS